MKKIILISMLLITTKCYALFNVVTKATLENRLSLQSNINTNLQNEMTGVKGDISGVKSNIDKLNLKIGQINNILSARVSGIDNSKNQSTSVGGNQAITNDTEIFRITKEMYEVQIKVWKYLFYALIGVVTLLIRQVFVFFNKYMFYKEQTLQRVDSEEELNHIKELQQKQGFVNRTADLIRQGKNIMTTKPEKEVI